MIRVMGDVIKKGLARIQNSTCPESKPILTIKTVYVLHLGQNGDLWDIYHLKRFYSSITPIKQVSADQLQNITVTDAEHLFGPYKYRNVSPL